MTLEALLGNSPAVFLGLTVALVGFTAWMTGQALALTWQPAWQAVLYTLLLGAANRFLAFALFDGALLAPLPYASNTAVLILVTLLGFRFNHVRIMARQYPWEWTRDGPFRLRRIGG